MKNTRVISKAAIFNGNDVLVVRRSNTDTKRPLEWDLPGGYVNEKEDFTAGCIREIREETGLELAPQNLYLAHAQSQANNSSGSDSLLIFVGRTNSKEIKLSHEHDKFKWVSLAQAIDGDTHPLHLKALKHIQENSLVPPKS